MEESTTVADGALEAIAGEDTLADDLGDGAEKKGSSIYAEGYDT